MLTIWHNPRCRKSRETLEILENSGKPLTIRRYLEDGPSVLEIEEILSQLGFEDPRELMRRGETLYKELNLKSETNSTKLIESMAQNPILIERPVVTNGQTALIGRPPEAVMELI